MGELSGEVVSAVRRISTILEPPPIARVLVPAVQEPPDRHGGFCVVQLADGSTGIAYVLLGDVRRAPAAGPATLAGCTALSVAEHLTGRDLVMRSLALAAANAATRHLLDRAGFLPDFATSSLGSLALGPDDLLGMVGFFPPLVRRAQAGGVPLIVLELRAELVREEPGLTVTLDPARLGACTKIVCTSTTLLNETLERVLAHARAGREFVVVGPSAGCVPDPLFARGVTGIGGAWVTDPAALMERAGRGEPWGDATRKFSLRADRSWPGLDELLRRARAR